jgi:hypothetical protein
VEVDHVTPRRWFLPSDVDLLAMLREQAAITTEGMHALVAWSEGAEDAGQRVRDCEHRADHAKRALWRSLRDAFSPPIDAEDLFTLSADLDEVLNGAKDLVREMEVMGMTPDPAMHEMSVLLSDAVTHLSDAFAAMGEHHDHGDPTTCADAAIKSGRRTEHAYRTAMSALLDVAEVREVVGRREAYRRLARIGETVNRVADRVWYSVVKER